VTRAARGAWPRRWSGVGASALWALIMLGLAVAAWLDHLLRQAGSSEVAWLKAGNVPAVVAAVSAATVGLVLASRRPAHPVGWLLLGIGLLVPLAAGANAYAHYGVMVRPGRCRAPATWRGSPTASPSSGRPVPALSCCSPRPGRCPRRVGGGGPGWRRPPQ